MNGQVELSALLHVPGVTTLLTKPEYIYNDNVLPDNGNAATTINYYLSFSSGPQDWTDTEYILNCRADSFMKAVELARAVRAAVNRKTSGEFYFAISTLAVISPMDSTDNYNAPVVISAKGREF